MVRLLVLHKKGNWIKLPKLQSPAQFLLISVRLACSPMILINLECIASNAYELTPLIFLGESAGIPVLNTNQTNSEAISE